jgi:uncharacterized Tic20 family protein
MTEPTPQPAAQPAAPLTEAEDKQWASFAHFGNLLVIAPLIIWLIFKDRGAKTNVEGKEAVNWSITYVIGAIVLVILANILGVALAFSGAWAIAGLFAWLPFLWWILNAVFAILGGVKVNGGGSYRYPFALRFIK